MDYLVYVEKKAENLQFFLWYCDYIDRWSKLSPEEKELSPIWDPDQEKQAKNRVSISTHRRKDSDKLDKILRIMEKDKGSKTGGRAGPQHGRNVSISRSLHERADSRSGHPVCRCNIGVPFLRAGTNGPKDSMQPFRDEVTKAIRTYVAESSPRQLDLFPQERTACLHSIQHTTHPSALLPAFLSAESDLKTTSHPAFTRWSVRNANRPRLVFLGLLATLVILVGFAVDVLLVMSRMDRLWRIACVGIWWPGFAVLFAAANGICLSLYTKQLRHLRPWEQFPDAVADDDDDKPPWSEVDPVDKAEKGCGKHAPRVSHKRKFSQVDPLRKASLQSFGPANEWSGEPWVQRYRKLSWYRKVFAPSVRVPRTGLRRLQLRVVAWCLAGALLVSTVLAVVSLVVSEFGLF